MGRLASVMDEPLAHIKASVLERVNVVDLIGSRLPLKKSGSQYVGLCPFHGEKTPSFFVSESRQRFKCFGCATSGNAIDFIMKYEGHDFMTSLKALGGEVGVDVALGDSTLPKRAYVPSIRLESVPQSRPPVPLDGQVLDWYNKCRASLSHPDARMYLEGRKIDYRVAEEMRVGFSRAGWVGSPDAPRLIFPQKQPNGAIVGLYGRRTDGLPTFKHRKLSSNVDGVFNAPVMLDKSASLWVTEGVFDALALRCAGVSNVVAIFGLGNMRWEWLIGQKNVVLAIDHDRAGEAGVERFRREAMMYGVTLLRLTEEELGGVKDVSQAWEEGLLRLAL